MPKRVQLSSDNTTFYTLPGNSAELKTELGMIDDTVFGQTFGSQAPNLGEWELSANGIFKGLAGYQVGIRSTGTPTTMTGEAMSLVSGKTYRITAATKRIIDPASPIVVKGNGIAIADANILNIDLLFGTVTFQSAYTPTTPITIDAKHLPTTVVGGAKNFSLKMAADTIDSTDLVTAQGNQGMRTNDPGQRSVTLELSSIFSLSQSWLTKTLSRNVLVVEICPDNNQLAVARGFFYLNSQSQSGDVGALEEETVNFTLSVPDVALMRAPFAWVFDASSTLSQALQRAINAWQNETFLYTRYYPPTGASYMLGNAVVTEISLSGGLESLNEFNLSFKGTGALLIQP